MKTSEYIKLKYAEVRPQHEHECQVAIDHAIGYIEKKHEIYINSLSLMGKFLYELRYSLEPRDAKQSFENVLTSLLLNCMVDKVKPVLSGTSYGFEKQSLYPDEYFALQYIEGYIKAQIPKWDVYWWVELGRKLGILELEN